MADNPSKSTSDQEFAESLAKSDPEIRRFIARGMSPQQASELGLTADREYREPPEPLRGWRKWLLAIIMGSIAICFWLLFIGAIGLRIYSWIHHKPETAAAPEIHIPTEAEVLASLKQLSVNDVIGWQRVYGDVIGQPEQVTEERFGAPDIPYLPSENIVHWEPSDKTSGRELYAWLDNGKVVSVVIKPRPEEYMPLSSVTEYGGFKVTLKERDPERKFGYWITMQNADGHCGITFTLNGNIELESVKFK